MMNEWSELNKLIITPDVKQIHCDTRDFYCILSKDNLKYHKNDHLDEQKRKKGIIKTIKKQAVKDCYLIEESEIITWLTNMELSSRDGCKNTVTWRFLSFEHLDGIWLKYIRMYRYSPTQFIVCDSYNNMIVWKDCNEENLCKKYLNSH